MTKIEQDSSKPKQVKEYDVFKDSLIRYLGYANEVGEAFRVLVPVSVVHFSYLVATGYVVADSLDKGYKVWKKPNVSDAERYKRVGIAATDTLIWQGFASVIVPGFTINRICWLSRHVLKHVHSLPAVVQKWSVVAAGLGSIPFIVQPIDRGVDLAMDSTVRKLSFWDH
ncbi:mitochondrial fission process protein 1 [Plakobranchus ocellatus]|uniref:Mitochondrial fission process protein 1 n=1 Tax=Plakobranchus ocellatus TaxID=259542 RepID=A0AAV4ASQ2_9GAST|nr:mitochondrial fission process protein 1 [Plakobranchus ocellatus]